MPGPRFTSRTTISISHRVVDAYRPTFKLLLPPTLFATYAMKFGRACEGVSSKASIRCGICNGPLTGELQKGNVYYRCHTKKCETKTVREETVISALTAMLAPLQFSAERIEQMLPLAEEMNRASATNREAAIRAATLR